MTRNILILLKGIPKTIYFNFHYLPFKQAIKLPILLFDCKLKSLKGKVIIDAPTVTCGMIKLGLVINSLYETTKTLFVWENRGTICFKGTCRIGSKSAISTGKNGYLEFGHNFRATASFKIACYKSIIIGDHTGFSWESIIIDTDFHESINLDTGARSIPSKAIRIGRNNWIGIRTLVLKGTETPDFCIVGASSLLNKRYDFPPYSLISGNPVELKKTGVYRDLQSFVE